MLIDDKTVEKNRKQDIALGMLVESSNNRSYVNCAMHFIRVHALLLHNFTYFFLDMAHAINPIWTQVYSKEGNHGPSFHEKLLAVGGRYDWLMEQAWDKAHVSCT